MPQFIWKEVGVLGANFDILNFLLLNYWSQSHEAYGGVRHWPEKKEILAKFFGTRKYKA